MYVNKGIWALLKRFNSTPFIIIILFSVIMRCMVFASDNDSFVFCTECGHKNVINLTKCSKCSKSLDGVKSHLDSFKTKVKNIQGGAAHNAGDNKIRTGTQADIEVHIKNGETCLQAGRYEDARRYYKSALALQPDNFPLMHKTALANMYAGYFDEAAGLYEQLVKLKPDNAELFLHMAINSRLKNEFQLESEYLKKAISLKIDYATAYNNLGFINLNSRNIGAACELFEQAIKCNPFYFTAYINKAAALAYKKDFNAAYDCLAKAYEINPDYHLLYYNLGTVLMLENKLDDAEEQFVNALKINTAHIQSAVNRSSILIRKTRFRDAIVFLKSFPEINHGSEDLFINLSVCYKKLGFYEEANEAARSACKINKSIKPSLYAEGISYNVLYDYDYDTCEQNINKSPIFNFTIPGYQHHVVFYKSFEDAYTAGQKFYEKNKFEKAAEAFSSAIKFNSSDYDAHIKLGISLAMKSDYDDAVKILKQAVKLKPDNVEAYLALGKIYVIIDDTELALDIIKNGLISSGDSFGLYYQLGLLYRIKKDDLNAVKCFEKSLELDSENAMAERIRTLVAKLKNTK